MVTWNIPSLAANAMTTVAFEVTANQVVTNSIHSVTAEGGYGATGSKTIKTEAYPVIELTKLLANDGAFGDTFGNHVDLSGDTAVIGARYNSDAGTRTGSAYIFDRNAGGPDNWGQVVKLLASDAAAYDIFGTSVAISGDTVVIGAAGNDDAGSDSGAAYIFERNAGGPNNWGQVIKLTASDSAAEDKFGLYVALSDDTIVVSSIQDDDFGTDSGSAYVFERNAGGSNNWGQVIKLTPNDGAAGDRFGRVAIDQDTIVVTAYLDDDFGTDSGSAYVFERNAGGSNNWGQTAKITPDNGSSEDQFGTDVAIEGDTLVVGAGMDDDQGTDSGSAYLFERDLGGPNHWGQRLKLSASDGGPGDWFGRSVAFSGDIAIIGAYRSDAAAPDSGAAYFFGRDVGGSDAWGQIGRLVSDDIASYDSLWEISRHQR